MARAMSEAAKRYVKQPKVKLKNRTRDYTREPGPHGRGEDTHCHDCLSCVQGRHQECEGWEMVMCRCWRTKHTDPPPPKGRKPIKSNSPYYEPPKQEEVNEDDFEWEDFE